MTASLGIEVKLDVLGGGANYGVVVLRDRYGISMTMSPAAAEVFEAGIALAQCYDPAFLDAFEAARAADPSACLPPLAIAVLGAGLPGIDVAGRVAEAEALSGRVSDRERSLVALTRLWVQSGVLGVEAAARKHLAR